MNQRVDLARASTGSEEQPADGDLAVASSGQRTEQKVAAVALHAMTLRHYARELVTAVRSVPQEGNPDHKPRGFWVSVDSCEQNWREWCESENFGIGSLAHDVRLRPASRILLLSSAADLLDFHERYRDKHEADRMHSYCCIKWGNVAAKYQGIIIAPYIWSMRLDDRVRWYYTWDCASGCIWDADAVATVTEAASVTA